MPTPLRIAFCSAEVAPLAKVGGLADVAGALPKALIGLGHDVRVFMPSYPFVERNPNVEMRLVADWFPVQIHSQWTEWLQLFRVAPDPGFPLYLVHSGGYFRGSVDSASLYADGAYPYIVFTRALLDAVPKVEPDWQPDILHCNDWHTGLGPAYLRSTHAGVRPWDRCAGVYTIHNVAHQGEFSREVLGHAGLPGWLFSPEYTSHYDRLNFLKCGSALCDQCNTVSPTYAAEVQTAEFGFGLEGLYRHLAAAGRFGGIVNGIDVGAFDPATDPALPANFCASEPSGKALCKAELQRECGLHVDPSACLIGMVTRIADQKGFDLLAGAFDRIMAEPVQFALLGQGHPHYERLFAHELAGRYPGRVYVRLAYDAAFGQRVYAGSDLFMMPSHFEPCGLGQLIAMRYGTLPVVRATGGLRDTVAEGDQRPGSGPGFVFWPRDPAHLADAVSRACAAFADKPGWARLVRRAMDADFSWRRSASDYVDLYQRALALRRGG